MTTVISAKQLVRRTGALSIVHRSLSSMLRDEKDGLMAPPIKIGHRSVAYIVDELEAVLQARIQGKSKEEIKLLVLELVASRDTCLEQI